MGAMQITFNPIHTFTPYTLVTYFNIIMPFIP